VSWRARFRGVGGGKEGAEQKSLAGGGHPSKEERGLTGQWDGKIGSHSGDRKRQYMTSNTTTTENRGKKQATSDFGAFRLPLDVVGVRQGVRGRGNYLNRGRPIPKGSLTTIIQQRPSSREH